MYISHSIIFYLGSLNNKYIMSYSSILLNPKSIPDYMTIFTSRWDKPIENKVSFQELAGYNVRNLPYVSHT